MANVTTRSRESEEVAELAHHAYPTAGEPEPYPEGVSDEEFYHPTKCERDGHSVTWEHCSTACPFGLRGSCHTHAMLQPEPVEERAAVLVGLAHHQSGDEYAIVVGHAGMIAFAFGPLQASVIASAAVLREIMDNQLTDSMEEDATWLEAEIQAGRAEICWTEVV